MNLFFLGNDFYLKSGTSMSSIYEVDTFRRMDWGSVQIALTEGKEIHIRPATQEEMDWAYSKLGRIVSEKRK